MGSGIAAMHYIGMKAMRLPARMEYRWGPVALSLGLAIAISLAALLLAFGARREKQASRRKLLSALIMGSAIPVMHYTGMWAVRFYACDTPFSSGNTVRMTSLSIVAVSVTSFLVMMLAIATAYLNRTLTSRKAVLNAARDSEARFHELAESIPQIVWTATAEGAVDYCNRRWYELTGFSEEQTMGLGWANALHPDDRPVVAQSWKRVLRTGEPFEMEYRMRDAAAGFRWHLARAGPMRDSTGTIVKWSGSCTDIEDQRHI
jgi:PAS domain S-box-containing protein